MLNVLVCMTICLCTSITAQITVQNTYQPVPGTVIQFPNDTFVDSIFYESLNAGAGGGMVWDFSTRGYTSPTFNYSVNVASTPEIDSFPSANLSLLYVQATDSSWQMYKSNSSEFTALGSVHHTPGADLIQIYENYTPEWNFPLNYNDQWTSYRQWKQDNGGTYTLTFDTTDYHADAWGTISYFTNSFQCIRIKSIRRFTTNTYDSNDMFLGTFSQTVASTYFITAGFKRMVSASKVTLFGGSSYSSAVMGEFTNLTTDITDFKNENIPNGYVLSQNYPNPFNPSTEIHLSIPYKAQTRLVVYNILGREVTTLVDKELAAGEYTIQWDGFSDDGVKVASGIYLYQLISDNINISKKMILLK